MQEQQDYVPVDTSGQAATLEDQLMAALQKATKQVGQCESFDEEQRAEVYTILQAIKSDTQLHRQLVGHWISQKAGETTHA